MKVPPLGVNAITAKWIFSVKADCDGFIIKAKATLVARGIGRKHGFDSLASFATAGSVSSIKVAHAIAIQAHWTLYHCDVRQALVSTPLDSDVFKKFSDGCGRRSGELVRLGRAHSRRRIPPQLWPQ